MSKFYRIPVSGSGTSLLGNWTLGALSSTEAYIWYIYEVKIVLKKISEHSQRESNPWLPIAGTVVLPLDHRVSDSNAMLIRDLVLTESL